MEHTKEQLQLRDIVRKIPINKYAYDYALLFKKGEHRYGRLLLVANHDEEGKIFSIYVMAKRTNKFRIDRVKVYGLISGTVIYGEKYGWIYKGRWQEDFEKIIKQKECEDKKERKIEQILQCHEEAIIVNEILDEY